jgi:hypothetical protein
VKSDPAKSGKSMADLKFNEEITALLIIDPHNDFTSERGII